jgi:hypothetical protein
MTDLTIYRGEQMVWQITATENSAAIDLTGASLYFAVRDGYPASTVVTEAGALIAKSTADDITLTTPASGIFEIAFDKADTNTLSPGIYLYGFEYVPSGETDPQILAQGKFSILEDVVRAV